MVVDPTRLRLIWCWLGGREPEPVRADLDGPFGALDGGLEPGQVFSVSVDVEVGNLPGNGLQVVGQGPDISEPRRKVDLGPIGHLKAGSLKLPFGIAEGPDRPRESRSIEPVEQLGLIPAAKFKSPPTLEQMYDSFEGWSRLF